MAPISYALDRARAASTGDPGKPHQSMRSVFAEDGVFRDAHRQLVGQSECIHSALR